MVGTLSLCLPYGQVASLAITGRGIVFSRHDVSELCMKPPPSKAKRAQGTPDAGRTREPCVQRKVHFAHASNHRAAKSTGIPCAMVYGLYAISPVCRA